MKIETVGIIGAGTMGNGIAQACATSGINVVMVDISEAAVQKGLATVAGSLDRLITLLSCGSAAASPHAMSTLTWTLCTRHSR